MATTAIDATSRCNELAAFFRGTGSGNMASVVVGWKDREM